MTLWLALALAGLALQLPAALELAPAAALAVPGLLLGALGLSGLWLGWRRSQRQQHLLHQGLLEAIEAMPAGFELWDAEDRLILCNERLRQTYPEIQARLRPGARFEDLVRQSLREGRVQEAVGREEAWLTERLAARGRRDEPTLQHYGERWTRIHEQRTASGLLVGVRLDVTELYNTQQALAQARGQAQAERQLLERAIDALPAGIEIHDEQDRLVLANRRMAAWLPHLDYAQAVGRSYRDMLEISRAAAALPLDAQGREREWIQARLQQRGRQAEPMLEQMPGGLWLKTCETRTPEGYLVAVRQDVSDLVRKEQELQASQAQLQAIIVTAGAAIVTTDDSGRMLSANPAVERLFGYSATELLGQNISLLMDEPDRGAHDHYLRRRQGAEGARELPLLGRTRDFNALHKSGRALTVQVSVSEIRGPQGRLYVGMITDLTERKQFEIELQHANEQLLRLSTTDALTELANRRLLMQKLEEEWRRGMRLNAPLSLLLVDVDHFKLYNDHYGHQAGDHCLRQVARCLRSSVGRPTDLVARYGGEEFVLLLAQTDADGARAVAERCRAELAAAAIEHVLSPLSRRVSISIGLVSAVPQRGGSASQWLAQADLALYQAKAQGRDRAVTAAMMFKSA